MLRYLKMLAGAIGALLSATLLAMGLRTGALAGFSPFATLATGGVQRASQGSSFWFLMVFWLAACAGCLWLAWSAYRD